MSLYLGDRKIKGLRLGGGKVRRVYLGDRLVWSAGNTVTYICNGKTYQEEKEEGEACLTPKTFTPSRSGYTFVGWALKEGGEVLKVKDMGEEPVTLYAVWLATPHYFTPLNSVTWAASDTRGEEYSLTPSASSIQLRCKKAEGSGSYGNVTASAKIPTGGCRKVRLTVYASQYAGGYIKVSNISKSFAKNTTSDIDFDISGDYIDVVLNVADGTAYFTATLQLTSIYFYN